MAGQARRPDRKGKATMFGLNRDNDLATHAGLDDGEEAMSDAAAAERISLAFGQLRGAKLAGAYLAYADLRGADLSGASLQYANLRGADLTGAILRGADLTAARLEHTDLSGADLRSAVLASTTLQGALFDGRTRWPRRPAVRDDAQRSGEEIPFDPRARGARMM
jgi:uncharacterized protein YjbI with pentapeptide repeats